MNNTKDKLSRKVVDTVDRVTRKISDAGKPDAPGDRADKMEHTADHSKDLGGNIVDRKY